ncbi:class II fructose-bisphosphate aldolase [Vagococcus sp. BWB3-3]|uniref:Class II fructose-bisphosphate aldolase n=1 Tax=Vagococcus allomyrinae TaxID=2794353 RepID=A0A940P7W2_9ENTE|nr:class II fructose-bisphosphate aldolase [Vagococcus allomyrinae]MBP1039572.1 class II fructose-bisphosphate aldolase [Vagococcus allomyrinae]
MLVTLKDSLVHAEKENKAVGAFNVPNYETLRAVIHGAEELNVPVIIQHAEVHENLMSLSEIGPMMIAMAKKAKVPVAVHLDHGSSFEKCMEAIRLGFTSVMYDASDKPFAQNLAETKEIVKIAHAVDVSVEAELGSIYTSVIGGGEGRVERTAEELKPENMYTDPKLAKEFVTETGIDCLAIAFGAVHGLYLTKPQLDLKRISQIKQEIDLPFVMHGGSGVSAENYAVAINSGIRKINYYTYMNQAGGRELVNYLGSQEANQPPFFDTLSLVAYEGMKRNVKEALVIFNQL